MTYPSCHDCRFWTAYTVDTDLRYFIAPDHLGDLGDKAEWGTCGREFEPDPPMYTNDASAYFSALRTRATFSCAAHQPAGAGQ